MKKLLALLLLFPALLAGQEAPNYFGCLFPRCEVLNPIDVERD